MTEDFSVKRTPVTEADMRRSVRALRARGFTTPEINRWLRLRFVDMGLLQAHDFIQEALNSG
jgi:hypothetical protein